MILLLKKAKIIISNDEEKGIKLSLDVNISNERPKSYKDIIENQNEVKNVRKKVAILEKTYNTELTNRLISNTSLYVKEKVSGIYGDVVIKTFNDEAIDALKQLASSIVNKLDNGIVFLINVKEDSLNFIAKESNSLKDTFNVGNLIKNVSKIASGSGGGSALFAQGGGSSVDKLDMILTYVKSLIEKE